LEALEGTTQQNDPQPEEPACTDNVPGVRHAEDPLPLEIDSLRALPSEVLERPGLIERVRELAERHSPTPPPCPTRTELLRLLA
jgi:hypothetical protein